jgi:small Trp-rich protein
MAFLVLGIVFLTLKLTEYSVVATWPWWGVLAPFGLAVLWWSFADAVGLTQKRAMQKMDDRKEARRREHMTNLGLDFRSADRSKRKKNIFQSLRQRQIAKIEGKRAEQRQKNRDSLLSRMDSRATDDAPVLHEEPKG